MKKAIAFFSAFFLVCSAPTVFAQMPLGASAVPATGVALEQIGVVAAAQGKVELKAPGQIGRIAQSGQAVYMGDEVMTDDQGRLQILLLDETVFTIGPNSSIIIDQFVYDPKDHSGEIKASVTKGVFRYVSGKIAAKNPNAVKVRLPTATLGFRGTIVGGSVGTDGQGLTGLLGPGSNNDAGAQNGSFSIDGDNGDHQNVNQSGFGVQIGAGGSLSNVFQLSNDQVNGLTGGLGGGNQGGGNQGSGDQGGGSGGEGGLGGDTNMGDLSGENNALTGGNLDLTLNNENLSGNLVNQSILGAQNSLDESGQSSSDGSKVTLDSVTTSADLSSYASVASVCHFVQENITLLDSGGTDSRGTYSIFLDIHFDGEEGNPYIGGGNSRVDMIYISDIAYPEITTNLTFVLDEKNFSTDIEGTITENNPFTKANNNNGYTDVSASEGGYSLNLDVTVHNNAGEYSVTPTINDVATSAEHALTLIDTSPEIPQEVATGSGTEAERVEGEAPTGGGGEIVGGGPY